MEIYIVSAAQRNDDGLIIASPRHKDPVCRALEAAIGGNWKGAEQGFVDSRQNFLTREEALVVALKQNQRRRRCGGDEHRLYSENLY